MLSCALMGMVCWLVCFLFLAASLSFALCVLFVVACQGESLTAVCRLCCAQRTLILFLFLATVFLLLVISSEISLLQAFVHTSLWTFALAFLSLSLSTCCALLSSVLPGLGCCQCSVCCGCAGTVLFILLLCCREFSVVHACIALSAFLPHVRECLSFRFELNQTKRPKLYLICGCALR